MIISDLNHLEAISQTVDVTGGNTINIMLPPDAIVKFFSQTSQKLNGTQVDSTAGTFTTPDGSIVNFTASVASSTSP